MSASPIALIRDLQAKTLDPSSLDAESRRTCVEHLTAEGYGAAEVAEVLKVSPRTVYRDLEEVRAANALQRTPGLVDELSGELLQQARQSIGRLRRISRERDCPHSVKVEAERSAWTVAREATETMQRLGILPTAAHEIRADLTHRLEGPPDFRELETQAEALEGLLLAAGGTDADMERLRSIQGDLARHRAGEGIRVLEASLVPRPEERNGGGA